MRAAPSLAAVVLLVGAGLAAPPLPRDGAPAVITALAALEGNGAEIVAGALRALAAAEGRTVPAAPPCPGLEEGLALHAARLGVPAPTVAADVAADLDAALGCVLLAAHLANEAHDRTFHGVPVTELLPFVTGERELRGANALAAGRSHADLLDAAAQAAELVSKALPVLAAAPLGQRSGWPELDLHPILRLETGADTFHVRNYAVVVDLGGDDTYDSHAGGVFAAAGGPNFYQADETHAYMAGDAAGNRYSVAGHVQDADVVLSSSIVLDVSGADAYGVRHPPMLRDRAGCTQEPIVPWVGTQGGGIVGLGMLLDLDGGNTFAGRTQTQGAGHILGVGVLYTGPGDDHFEAIRAAQGSGLLGGVGVLIDRGGPATYVADVPPGGVFSGDQDQCVTVTRYVQGSAFDRDDGPLLPAVGVLLDLDGADTYRSNAGALAQGFGQGPGLGLLLDAAGADRYEALDRAQGAAQGRSKDRDPQAPWGAGLALLLDAGGADTYVLGGRGQGWAWGYLDPATAPAVDPDRVQGCLEPIWTDSAGCILDPYLQWGADRQEAVGVLLDLGGSDTYAGPAGRADSIVATEGLLGIFVDA